MPQHQFRRPPLVQHNIRHAFNLAMSGHGYHRQIHPMGQHGVDHKEPFDRAIQKKTRILLNQVWLTAMTGGQVEIPLLDEILLDTGQHLRCITIAQFRNEHTHQEGLALAQRPCIKARPVVEFGSRLRHPVPGLLRNRPHAGSVVEHQRDRSRGEVQVLA